MLDHEGPDGATPIVGNERSHACTRHVEVLLERSAHTNATMHMRADPMFQDQITGMYAQIEVERWRTTAPTAPEVEFLAIIQLIAISGHESAAFSDGVAYFRFHQVVRHGLLRHIDGIGALRHIPRLAVQDRGAQIAEASDVCGSQNAQLSIVPTVVCRARPTVIAVTEAGRYTGFLISSVAQDIPRGFTVTEVASAPLHAPSEATPTTQAALQL